MGKQRQRVAHRFVETMPEELDEGVLYISILHRLALHRCLCGCGTEISTPLAPVEWKLTFDGETVSLNPSVGVWGLPCQSHYWIKRSRVHWSGKLSREKIERIRARERVEHAGLPAQRPEEKPIKPKARPGLFTRISGNLRQD